MEYMARRLTLSDQVRAAVEQSGIQQKVLCQATGIDPGSLCRFVAGKSGLTLSLIDRLADELDLHLVTGNRKPGKGA